MNKQMIIGTIAALAILAAIPSSVTAQESHAGHAHAATAPSAPPLIGPHGGTLRQADGIQVETVVTAGGLQLFVYDRAGQAVSVQNGRGVASVCVDAGAKRYRYNLLPDDQESLSVAVNLSKIAGRQIEIDVQLVGVSTESNRPVTFREIASVPADQQQLVAAAIARQKTCPVSGKPLGSMGDPVSVDVNGENVYVCCSGCQAAVKSNPAKYASGSLPITVTNATAADAPLIAKQASCPVMDEPLGSMGGPIKVMVGEQPIFLCCKGCIKKIKAEPAKYLAMVYGQNPSVQAGGNAKGMVAAGGDQVRTGVFKVTEADAKFVAVQKRCPVMDEPLDAMGGPYKVNADGQAIYICCPGCAKSIAANPKKYLAILSQQGVTAPVLR